MMVKLKINTAALQAATNSGSPPNPSTSTSTPSSKPSKTKNPKPSSSSLAATPSTSKPKSSKPKKSKPSALKNNGAAPSPAPLPTPTGLPKIKFKSSGSALPSPVPATPTHAPAKPARPTLKLTSSSFNTNSHAMPPPVQTPILKLKTKAKPPATTRKRRHEPGSGYDSEASDREDDPAIEEQFILRMPPGPDCDYLREVIERRELNVTSDVWMKFKDPRRAVVCVRGNMYGATLVDLPCIIESSKTLDKKNVFKTADICQMLLVGERIQREEDTWELPTRIQDVTFPHGITPPMQHVRRRRFRKRISNRTIEAVEAEVDRLLRDDESAADSRFQLIDAADLAREEEARDAPVQQQEEEGYDLLGEDAYDSADADGDADEDYPFPTPADPHAPADQHPQEDEEMDEDTLANDLDLALMGDDDESDEDEGEGDGDGDGDAGGQQVVVDEAAKEKMQQRVKLEEEIADLREAIGAKEREYMRVTHSVLKQRVGKVIEGFRTELELKEGMLAQMNAS